MQDRYQFRLTGQPWNSRPPRIAGLPLIAGTGSSRQSRMGFALIALLLLAEGLIRPAHAESPDPAALYHEGLVAAQAGEFARAKEQFEAALRAAPQFLEAQFNLGLVEQQLAEPARARVAFERVLTLDPSHASARRSLAATLAQLGEDSLALRTYDVALHEDSTRTDLYYRKAEIVRRMSKEPAARPRVIEALREALAKDPHRPEAFDASLDLGSLLFAAGDLPAAVRAFERGLEIRPDSPIAHYNCAVVLERMGRYPEAVTHLEQAIHTQSSYSDAHFALAGIYYGHLEDDEKALLHYEIAMEDSAFALRSEAMENASALRTYLERRRAERGSTR